MLPSGTRLGPYEVLGLIGEGGMGQVYRAADTRLDRAVAIKVMPAALAEDPPSPRVFAAVAFLQSRHIAFVVHTSTADVERDTEEARMAVQAIPEGYYSLTPYLVIKGAAEAIEFYTKVFGATEILRMPGPGGRIMHAEVKIGNSVLMLSDENPERGYLSPASRGGATSSTMFYTDDVDATFKKAVAAGAKAQTEPADMFWGDRMANLTDPFGHSWAIATHKEDVSPDEMEKRMQMQGA